MSQITGLDSLVYSSRLMNAEGLNPLTQLCLSGIPTLLRRRLRNLENEGSNPSPVIFFMALSHNGNATGFELDKGFCGLSPSHIPRNLQLSSEIPVESGSIPDRAFILDRGGA